MSMLSSLTDGGGLSGSSSADARSGNAGGGTYTGNKNINIGGNPNVSQLFAHPLLIIGGVVLAVWLWRKYR